MNKILYLLKVIFKNRFLSIANIVLIALTVMFVVQEQLKYDSVTADNPNEPYVHKSLYLTGVSCEYPDKRTESFFAGPRLYNRMTTMKTPENVSIFTWVRYQEKFENGKTIDIAYRATDHRYWQVMKFNFLEGKPYTKEEVENKSPLIVISETSRKRFFGNEKQVAGRQVEIEGRHYTVCGVVEDVPYSSPFAFGEYWIPYTVWKISEDDIKNEDVMGLYVVQIKAKSKSDFGAIHKEFMQLIEQLNREISSEIKITRAAFGTRGKIYFAKNRSAKTYERSAGDIWRSFLSTFWILLVPLLAMIALNYARSNERSLEVGIRRVFGAPKGKIGMELIFENSLIILIGMGIGIFLGYLAIHLYPVYFIGMDTRDFNGGVWLPFTFNMLTHLIFTFVVFLLASAALPIVRAFHQSILNLLKGGEL